MGQLTGPQQIRLRTALRTVYPTPNDFDGLLLAFSTSLADLAPANSNYPAAIIAAVQQADSNSWLFDLITAAISDHPLDPALIAIEAELKTFAPPPATNPFEVSVLGGGHVMVNRTTLRNALKELCTAHGRRILVVKDGPTVAAHPQQRIKTGKSHTSQMVSYLAQVHGGFKFFRIDLETVNRSIEAGLQIQPYHIGKSLTAFLGCKELLEEPPKDGQWARWTLDFCDAFEKAAKAAGPVWLVIDSFHVVLLPLATVGLLKELAMRINTTIPDFRMLLLGYPETLHPLIPVCEDVLDIFGEDALIEFFARAYAEKNAAFDEAKVAANVEAVLKDLDPKQPDFVARIGSLVVAELNKP
jgi:hypothetical protein